MIDSFEGDTGIGLGSQISQLVELAVLDDLDHYIKERLRIKHYLRYMDDFVLIHPDKRYMNGKKLGKQRRKMKKLMAKERAGLLAEGTTRNSFIACERMQSEVTPSTNGNAWNTTFMI